MQLHFEDHDFHGENAPRTASLMRAMADALSPRPTKTLSEVVSDLRNSEPDAFSEALDRASQRLAAGTVATHVSAEAAGDVPFPEETVERGPEEPPAPTNGVDSAGNPWDERIHASSRGTVADGTWRMKRGVSDELVAQVRAEWDAKLRPASVAPAPTEAERLQADHVATMPPDPATVGFGGAPAVPPPPAATDTWPTDILGARDESLTPFQQFMQWVMPKIQSAQLTNARLLEVLNANGVPLLPSLASPEHADKIGAIVRSL